MKKTALIISCLFFSITAPRAAEASELEITASASRQNIALNEQLEIRVTVSGEARNIPQPTPPEMENFRTAGSGRSQSVSIINGRVNSSVTFNYVLYPRKTGEFTIPPFKVTYRGKEYSTDPIAVSVGEAPQAPQVPQPGAAAEAPQVFVSQEVDRKSAFLGEQITYTFRFYHRIRLIGNPSFHPPSFAGFFSREMPPHRNYTETVNGVQYHVTEVRHALFAQRSGNLAIDPASLVVSVDDVRQDPFQGFFFSGGRQQTLRASPLSVEILPLPPGAPEDFTGAVGRFTISAVLEKESVKQGEPVSLEITVSGEGDIRPVAPPRLPGLNNFRVFESVSSENTENKNYRVTGSKTIKTLVVPAVSGRLSIPPVSFSYFDTAEKAYRTVKTRALQLNVAPAPAEQEIFETTGDTRLQVVREDIRYITSSRGRKKTVPLFREKGFWPIGLIPGYLWIAALLLTLTKRSLMPGKETLMKRSRIRALLKEANFHAEKGNALEAYRKIEEISNLACIDESEACDILARAKKAVYSPEKDTGAGVSSDLKEFSRILKRTLKIFLLILISFSASASAGELDRANSLYSSGEYSKAAEAYLGIIETEGESEGLCYNLGNSYWRMGETGKARLYWEKALRINPAAKDALYNISLVRESINEESEPGLAQTVAAFYLKMMSLNTLILLVSASGWATLLFFLGYYLKRREKFAWAGVSSILVFLLFFASLLLVTEAALNRREGITLQRASIYSSPDKMAQPKGTVPEGSKIIIIDESGDWFSAGIEQDNIRFWIPRESAGEI